MNLSTKYSTPAQPGKFDKKRIVLHFTAGSTASGAVASWQANFKVKGWALGTPYIVDRDPAATVYEVFDPLGWAYHLGSLVAHEQQSIGIEIVNWGPLLFDSANQRYTPIGYPSMSVPPAQAKRSVFRGQQFFQTFPEAQVQAVADLVKMLCRNYKIPAVVPPLEKREQFAPEWAGAWSGICGHTNFRNDKYDMGPAWDWSKFQEMIR